MAHIQLKVSTDVLKKQAAEIEGQIEILENNWKQLGEIVAKTKNYWQGDASDYHQKFYKANKDDVENVIKRLKEHPKDLLTMAGVYEQAETKSKQLASALPTDVIK